MTEQERRAVGARLLAERKARRWSRHGMARKLLSAVGIAPDPKRVRNMARQILDWEKGKNFPRDWAEAYTIAYDIPYDELFGTVGLDWRDDLPSTLEADPRPSSQGDDPVRRRALLQGGTVLAADATIAPILTTLTSAWQASEPTLPGATVSRSMLDDWENAYEVHATSYRIDPPTVVLTALAWDWADIAPHLRRKQPDGIDRDLAHAASRHAFLIAGGMFEMGNRRHAHRWWTTSRELADKSRDHRLASLTRSWEVTNRFQDDREDPAELLLLAREARRLAGERPSFALIYSVAEVAWAYAAVGDQDSSIATIHEVETLFERLPSTGDRQWGEERLRFNQSRTYSLVGDVRRASEAQAAAHGLHRPNTYATVQIALHEALLCARRDPEEALAQGLQIVTELPQERRIARVQSAARQVVTALPDKARELPAARELQALITAT
ncbi:hypothetical protein [Actinomadura rubrisoli]|uniref:XRE family transcriptional regulator n=1 Tax=Actinomadura rubrisoli TaxID=2530368 RepID=A0A4V2YV34_9ACTN|nr:hypothetical protein [Actinomadura rubrisoli]TDD79667.1 hypothetical protein E1298_27335 [Actinomadura rubrisoli]